MRIGKNKAQQLIVNSKGQFMGITFKKKDNAERSLHCQYTGQSSPLGYVLVKSKGEFKNVNLQTISEIKINKECYKVR